MPQIKNPEEIEKIRHACQITDRIFTKMRKYLGSVIPAPEPESRRFIVDPAQAGWQKIKNITEKELETWLLDQIQHAWCTPSFHPIIAAGANAAHPHWRADDTMLDGFVVIDFGVVYEGYMSDMTRTIYVSWPRSTAVHALTVASWKLQPTRPTEEELNLYTLVLKAQQDSMDYIKPGRYCKDAHWVAAATLGEHKKYFIHSLGHGIGTIIHEHPRLSPKAKSTFKKNMCVTVEPGVYIQWKLWIRIEDTCLVTEKWCEQITKSTKKLLIF